MSFSIEVSATELFVATSDLNIRSGPATSFKSLDIIEKGDTVIILENTNASWVKIKYQDVVGYSSTKYLVLIQSPGGIDEQTIERSSFITILFVIVVALIAIIFLIKSGKKYRNRSFAAFLALLFGTFGLQKFYLGQSNKGTYSLLFCWTIIPTIVGLTDFIKLLKMNNLEFNNAFNNDINRQVQSKTSKSFLTSTIVDRVNSSEIQIEFFTQKTSTINKSLDETIIDVNTESLDLDVEKNEMKSNSRVEVPDWSHSYVYSYDEIRYASKQQKEFYFHLRENLINGKLIDIKGNTNYAFILYFDLLNEYENHQDIELLEKQFKLLGECCPKTKSYTVISLQDLLRNKGDSYSQSRLKELQDTSYQFEHGFSDYDPDAYKLGKQYKEKLGLNKLEVAWLNKFWNPSNVFTSIDGCCIAIIKQYLSIIKELNKILKEKNTSIAKEVDYFKEIILDEKGVSDSEWGYYGKTHLQQRAESDIYLTIFKRVENSVRESFGHKRKVGDLPYYNFKDEFERRIGFIINVLVIELKDNIEKPDITTQIELNAQNVNRWKNEFFELKMSFQKDEISRFIEGIILLEETNQKNPNIESVFYEASTFISECDKVQALKYYAKYIYYDLKSKKFDNKQLTKTIQKSLFRSEEQLNEYRNIIEDLIKSANIEKALDEIPKIYIPKRKRIVLDETEIKSVEQKHIKTVELLNEYLDDEKEENTETIQDNFTNEDEISFKAVSTNNSLYNSDLNINDIQEQLIQKIAENSFIIHQNEVEEFAMQNGVFKNQLVDSINDICSELLEGEVLIEEDEENYIIEESYYNEITK